MKNALIICAGGMSSSLLAKKVSDKFVADGKNIKVNATGTGEGAEAMENDDYDLYLISPQTKMHYNRLAKIAEAHNKPVVNIPAPAYVQIPMGIDKLAKLIEENI